VFLSNLSTPNSISSACYLYTIQNKKIQPLSVKAAGGCGGCGGKQLVAGGWAVTAGGCLP
jgi:hypothetical protein